MSWYIDKAEDGVRDTTIKNDYHYQQFVQQQRKRETNWKLERKKNQLRKKKKQNHDFHSPDLEHFTSTCEASDASTQTDTGTAIDLQRILTECELLKNKINELDEKTALAINMLKVTV